MSVDHYENFPVASWLCPPALRPPIQAIYHFARTADDLADEGESPAAQRRQALTDYRAELAAVHAGASPSGRWPGVFDALATAIRVHELPWAPLDDLLDAFLQDTGNPLYPDRQALLDYCRRSANPIGRLLLHLYRIDDPGALRRSDAICSALQLINFWQDFSIDHPRGRCYLPEEDCRRHGVDRGRLLAGQPAGAAEAALLTELLDWTDALMTQGQGLVHDLPGRVGWELRFVVQGGRRILEKIRRMNPDSFHRRPRLGRVDALPLAWRALIMREGSAT